MEWTRSETLALASPTCSHCHGNGQRSRTEGPSSPCNCVLRAIFRACYNRFRYCASKEKALSRVSLEFMPRGGGRRSSWGRKDEEYCADFLLVSRRALDNEEYKIFSYHFLLGADWKLCTRKLKMDRGLFFHAIYRIQQKLGKVFRELEPYALYPLDEYFSTVLREAAPASEARELPGSRKVVPIRPLQLVPRPAAPVPAAPAEEEPLRRVA